MHITRLVLFGLLCSILLPGLGQQQATDTARIFKAATDIMHRVPYCALITMDEKGQPQARTMESFPPEENFAIWFGTNRNSRKVREIKNDPRVTVYYQDEAGNGYVVITGAAVIVDDPAEKEKHWMERWAKFYPDRADYLLIKVIPKTLEVVNYQHDLTGDKVTWRAPHVELKK